MIGEDDGHRSNETDGSPADSRRYGYDEASLRYDGSKRLIDDDEVRFDNYEGRFRGKEDRSDRRRINYKIRDIGEEDEENNEYSIGGPGTDDGMPPPDDRG